jgi:DNA-binding transcriptional LysR family regulator
VGASNITLVDLRVVLAVAEEGSVTRGAQRVHLSPSTVSQRIAQLEEALGVTLFQRQPHGVVPSSAGYVMVDHAKRTLAQVEQLHSDLTPFSAGVRGHVSLYANTSALTTHIPKSLELFFPKYPNIRLTIQEKVSPEIVHAVSTGRVDIGVVGIEGTHPDLEFRDYSADELVVIAKPGDLYANRQSLKFSDCVEFPFVSLHSGAALHTYLVQRASDIGKRLDVRVQVCDYRTVCQLVAAGAGFSIVPKKAIVDFMQNLAIFRLDEIWASRSLRVCWKASSLQMNSSASLLIEHLLATRGE